MSAMTELGYPNTYTFTKAIGEHLLVRALRAHNKKLLVKTPQEGFDENDIVVAEKSPAEGRGRRRRLKLRIMRPSIVGPSWVFPWPGWASEQPSTVTGGGEDFSRVFSCCFVSFIFLPCLLYWRFVSDFFSFGLYSTGFFSS